MTPLTKAKFFEWLDERDAAKAAERAGKSLTPEMVKEAVAKGVAQALDPAQSRLAKAAAASRECAPRPAPSVEPPATLSESRRATPWIAQTLHRRYGVTFPRPKP